MLAAHKPNTIKHSLQYAPVLWALLPMPRRRETLFRSKLLCWLLTPAGSSRPVFVGSLCYLCYLVSKTQTTKGFRMFRGFPNFCPLRKRSRITHKTNVICAYSWHRLDEPQFKIRPQSSNPFKSGCRTQTVSLNWTCQERRGKRKRRGTDRLCTIKIQNKAVLIWMCFYSNLTLPRCT